MAATASQLSFISFDCYRTARPAQRSATRDVIIRFGGWRRHVPCCLASITAPRTCSIALAGASLVAAIGCTIDVGRLPVVSTRPVGAAELVRPPELERRVHGRSCVWVALAVPLGPLPSLGNAIGDALAAGSAPALWDARIRYELIYVPPIGRGCYVVEGSAP